MEVAGLEAPTDAKKDGAAGALVAARDAERERRVRVMVDLNMMSKMTFLRNPIVDRWNARSVI